MCSAYILLSSNVFCKQGIFCHFHWTQLWHKKPPTLGDSSVELETFFWSWSFLSFFSFLSRLRSFFSRRSRSFSSFLSCLVLVPWTQKISNHQPYQHSPWLTFLPATALKEFVSELWRTKPRPSDFLAASRSSSVRSHSCEYQNIYREVPQGSQGPGQAGY